VVDLDCLSSTADANSNDLIGQYVDVGVKKATFRHLWLVGGNVLGCQNVSKK